MTATNLLRADVMAQPPADRLAYALDLLSLYLDPVPAFFDGCANMGLDLAARDVRVLFAMDQRRGRLVTRDALQAAAMVDVPRDAWGGPETVARRVAGIRRKLSASPYPLTVQTWAGVGYRLDGPADFKIESYGVRHAG